MSTKPTGGAVESKQPKIQEASEVDRPFIVGVGASAGGLEALEAFFAKIPADSGMAFVVVQHLSPDFKSLMNELLARHTQMEIRRVEDGMRVERDHIYLIPPKKNMILSDGKLLLSEQDSSGGLNLPIDLFFRSLAQDAGHRAVAVILSGTGSDGSRGICDVHAAGGRVLVQEVESAGFDGMPRNAIATGVADEVATPEKMPAWLLKYTADPIGFTGEETNEEVMPGSEMAAIFRLFRTRYGVDFTQYRSNTIQRRLERRMRLMQCRSLLNYVEVLEDDTAECEALYRDLLVEVTQFFRDNVAFERLQRDVVPEIMKNLSARDEVRVWAAGCATGEEAYSLAMIFNEAARRMNVAPVVKIFATDIHRNSLETASSGIYSAEDVQNVPAELRARYFTRHGDLYHVSRELRQTVIFAPHDITKDPPFTKIDLFCCRNVLIYLDTTVQRRILALFHFGLKVGGYMMLGPSETVGDYVREFETIDQHWRIYRKLRDVRLPEARSIPMSPALTSVVNTDPPKTPTVRINTRSVQTQVLDELLDRYVPPSFLVNEHGELVHSFGDARKMLVQPKGRPTIEVLKMVDGDLRMALSAAMHRAKSKQERVVFQGVRVANGDGEKSIQVVVEPYENSREQLYLVCLEEVKSLLPQPEPEAEAFDMTGHSAKRIAELEQELTFAKESLQTTVEELESSNEELQSTNEELVASNEELQSTNEELHSVNEELYTVNAEHQRKIEELTQLTADIDNLLISTEIGTIFLDRNLCIRKFTPAITSAFNVIEQDIGRPIQHIAYNLDNPDLLDFANSAIETGESVEMEVRGPNGKRYLKRIRPYHTASGKIDGVVLTFVDITELKQAQANLHDGKMAQMLLEATTEGIYGLDREGNCTFCNPACLNLLGYETEADLLGKHMHDLIHHTRANGETYPVEECQIYEAFRAGTGARVDDEVLWRADGTCFPATYWSQPIYEDGEVAGAVVAFLDDTPRRDAEKFLRQSEAKFRSITENLREVTWLVDIQAQQILYVSPSFEEVWGIPAKELYEDASLWTKAIHPEDRQRVKKAFSEGLVEGQEPYSEEFRIVRPDGQIRWLRDRGNLLDVEGSESTRVAGIAEDITEQKQGELERQRLLDLYENLPVLTASVNAQSKRVEECSKYLLERLGYVREDVVDHPLFDLYHEECLGDVEAAFGEFTSSGQVQRDRLALKAKDGSTLNVELRATAIRDDDGQIIASRSVWHETGG